MGEGGWEGQLYTPPPRPPPLPPGAAPAVFVLVGIRNETLGSVHGLHTPLFKLDEAVLEIGARMHAAFAVSALEAAVAVGGEGGGGAAGAGREEL